jgi:DNA segregation ATPase FtsK/SpoIIIE-like protein
MKRVDLGIRRLMSQATALSKYPTVLGSRGRDETSGYRSKLNPVEETPVLLQNLLQSLPRSDGVRVTLGADEQGRPIVFNLVDKRKSNILICGARGTGKTTLMRTIAASLALQNRQSAVQLGAIGLGQQKSKGRKLSATLESIGSLPHCIFPVIKTVSGGMDVLDFLITEVDYRREHFVTNPLLVIIIDDLDTLIYNAGKSIHRKLSFLMKHGPDAGLRLFLSIDDPMSKDLDPLLNFDFPVRIVGRTTDSNRAWTASGIPQSGAEKLSGNGQFVAVVGNAKYRFQAACLSEAELQQEARQITRLQRQVLVVARNSNVRSPHNESGQYSMEPVTVPKSAKETTYHDSGKNSNGAMDAGNESGSDEWLTRDWLDRFWTDQG